MDKLEKYKYFSLEVGDNTHDLDLKYTTDDNDDSFFYEGTLGMTRGTCCSRFLRMLIAPNILASFGALVRRRTARRTRGGTQRGSRRFRRNGRHLDEQRTNDYSRFKTMFPLSFFSRNLAYSGDLRLDYPGTFCG